MLEADLALLKRAAFDAAAIAKKYWQGTYDRWDKADGAGPVTQADLEIDALLMDVLRTARPNYGWLSEETNDDTARLLCERCFILDPLDGTRSFIEGDTHWAHSFAITRDGQVETAVVYLPILDLMFHAVRGGGAYCNDAPISVSNPVDLNAAKILAARPAVSPEHWQDGRVPQFEKHFRPSLAYRLALVAQGRFDGMITFRDSWEWDIAAGSLLVSEAGGTVTDRHGKEITFNSPSRTSNGILAASGKLHHDIRTRLAM